MTQYDAQQRTRDALTHTFRGEAWGLRLVRNGGSYRLTEYAPPRLVVVAGLYRSGSTWQYNAVRLILEAAGHDVRVGELEDCAPDHEGAQVIKWHRWAPDLARAADVVLTSYRPMAQAAASWSRFSENTPNRKHPGDGPQFMLQFAADHFARWQARTDYCLWWEAWRDEVGKEGCIRAMAKVLCCDVVPAAIRQQVEALTPPSDGMDPVTRLFSNHLTR